MEWTTADDLPSIQALWPRFERLVGLRGRKMYARVDERAGTYTVCTPVLAADRPAELDLATGVLPGSRYLRGHLSGDPPGMYARIGEAMAELQAAADDVDGGRPLVEFYRRRDHVELWVPVR